jgi:predicted HTH transcriptional regulator
VRLVIHADFMLNGILKVEKYGDKFVLTNPGLLNSNTFFAFA